jgi:hypothetical protein
MPSLPTKSRNPLPTNNLNLLRLKPKLGIGNGFTQVLVHFLVVRLGAQLRDNEGLGVDVVISVFDLDGGLLIEDFFRPVIEFAAIGFEVDDAVLAEHVPVLAKETRGRQATVLFALLEEGVGKGDPNFIYFAFNEEGRNDFNPGSKEGGIVQSFGDGIFSAAPDARAFDVYTNEVAIRVLPGKVKGIFSSTTGQLQDNRIVVTKVLFSPLPLQINGQIIDAMQLWLHGVVTFVDVGKGEYFGELLELVAGSHDWMDEQIIRKKTATKILPEFRG